MPASSPRFAARERFAAFFGGGFLDAFGTQLAAGGEDVAAARGADGGGVAGAVQNVGELLDRVPAGTFIRRAGPGVERDQVDLRRHTLQ